MNWLRRNVWGLDKEKIESLKAVKYGIENEPRAVAAYESDLRSRFELVKVAETGMWMKPMYYQLSCSPDGIVSYCDRDSTDNCSVLLEVKCLEVLKEIHPADFDKVLNKKQLASFCLKKVKGKIVLNRNHKLNYQIQMCMDLCEIYRCHFVVWSRKGIVILEIEYDDDFWAPKRQALIEAHRKIVIPEVVTKRAFRKLVPLVLDY